MEYKIVETYYESLFDYENNEGIEGSNINYVVELYDGDSIFCNSLDEALSEIKEVSDGSS